MSPQMAVSARGLYFVVTLFLGSFFGSIFMLGPVLPLMFLSPAWYRWITDRIVATWLTLPVVSAPSSQWLGPLKTASLNLLFLSISSSPPPYLPHLPYFQSLLELVFGVKVVITGDGFVPGERSVIIMNHRTRLDWMFLWCCLLRYSYLRLEKICLKAALKAVPGFGGCPGLSFTLFFSATQKSPHWLLVHPSSRLGYAGGLLRLHSAPLGGGQEAHGEHAGLLLRHQRAAAAAALPWRHRSHRWEGNNATSTFSPRRFQLLFSELDIQQHLSCTFALMPLCKYHFQMLKRCQILPGTPRQLFLKMLWSFNPCSSSTTDA